MTAALLELNSRTFSSIRKHRNYRLYFTGQIVSVSGTWMQDTALPWLVLALTHSPVYVGLLVFARYAPFMAFGLFSGALADRFDNRRFVIVTQASSMLIAAALAVLAFSHVHVLWPFFVLAFLGGAALVFDAPNRHALTFQLVGRDELPNAVALNSSLFNAGRVVGPAVGGVLIAAVGAGWCFAINAVSFLAVLAGLLLMRPDELFPLDRGHEPQRALAAAREGLEYMWRSPQVKLVLAVTLVVSATGFNFRVLLPVLAERTLHAGATTFGVLFASFGCGALMGALASAALARASWKALVFGSAGFSTAMLLLAPVRSTALAALLLLVIGFCFSTWSANSQSILQLTAPDRLRGRVLGLYLFVFAGFAPLGGLLAGWLADVGGTRLAFGVAGIAGLAVTAVAAAQHGRVVPPRRRGPVVAVAEEEPTS
ncbi:MAG TPA: MFS transporter [Gaiellaceae bacterium]|nr:MFS transporter [Gaiellaceae bacterium]